MCILSIIQISPEMTKTVSLPIWLVGLTCFITVALAGVFCSRLIKSLDDLSNALNRFQTEVRDKFVTRSTFDMIRTELKEDITDSNDRINKLVDHLEEALNGAIRNHKEDCPARATTK
jgi:hypothetical protein